MPAPTTTATEAPKCGKQFTRKVKGGNVKTYRCTKPRGHDGVHGLVSNKQPISVPASILTSFEAVPATEYVPLVSRDRTTEQQTVDQHVKEAYAEWAEAGKPAKPLDSPRKRYIIPAEHVDSVRTMLRRAGEFHKVRVQIAPPGKYESGGMSLQFRVTDRTEKTDGKKPSEVRAEAKADSEGSAEE